MCAIVLKYKILTLTHTSNELQNANKYSLLRRAVPGDRVAELRPAKAHDEHLLEEVQPGDLRAEIAQGAPAVAERRDPQSRTQQDRPGEQAPLLPHPEPEEPVLEGGPRRPGPGAPEAARARLALQEAARREAGHQAADDEQLRLPLRRERGGQPPAAAPARRAVRRVRQPAVRQERQQPRQEQARAEKLPYYPSSRPSFFLGNMLSATPNEEQKADPRSE